MKLACFMKGYTVGCFVCLFVLVNKNVFTADIKTRVAVTDKLLAQQVLAFSAKCGV